MNLIREIKEFVTHVPAPIPSVFDGIVDDVTRPAKADFIFPFQTITVGDWLINIPQEASVRLGTEIRVVRGEKVRINGHWYPVINQIAPNTFMAYANKVFPWLGLVGGIMFFVSFILLLRLIGRLFFGLFVSDVDVWQDFIASISWFIAIGLPGILLMTFGFVEIPNYGIRQFKYQENNGRDYQ